MWQVCWLPAAIWNWSHVTAASSDCKSPTAAHSNSTAQQQHCTANHTLHKAAAHQLYDSLLNDQAKDQQQKRPAPV
jgi:hypothetical protein